jgi:G3E family GTPase
MARLGACEREKIPLALHSDFPMAPAMPLHNAWVAFTRENCEAEIIAPSERITLDTALRAITIEAAGILGLDNETGSLRAGKKADFAILDKDPYEVGGAGLKDINQRLRNAGGVRYAVLVNDFGDLNIDVDLIQNVVTESDRTGSDGTEIIRSISLINGCVCCSLAGNENVALDSVLEIASNIDWVLLEASGVADSVRVKNRVLNWPGFEFKQSVTLVDVSRIQQLVDDKYVGRHIRQQLNTCDRMILTKQDLISAHKSVEIEQWLRCLTPDSYQDHPQFYSQALTRQAPLVREEFEIWLRNLDENVVRLKGFVYFDENPRCRYLVQAVGRTWEITRSRNIQSDQVVDTRINLISIIPVRMSLCETSIASVE